MNRILVSSLFIVCFGFLGSIFGQDIDKQIDEIISRMTLEEKVAMCHGNGKFSSAGIARLGIPDLTYSDGPHGVREEISRNSWAPLGLTNDSSSCLPAISALAATWNLDLARQYGIVLGSECKARGKDISLAPGVNIHRTPLNGRNWEYFSEDPFLTSRLAVQYIQGVQSQGVASCAKHFALNNQEYERGTINVEVDERTLREIYLPAFEACVKEAGVLTFMGAYNKFRGYFCCENDYLLQQILRKEWGFKGFVMSDWAAVHHTDLAAMNGLDVEMGTEKPFSDYYLANSFLQAIKSGEISEETVNQKVHHILYVALKLGLMQRPPYNDADVAQELATPAHQATALAVAEEAIVLLKNSNHKLPVDVAKVRSIAIIGANADTRFAMGGGSTTIKAKYEITPLEGIRKQVGNSVKIEYAPGYRILRNDQDDPADRNLFTEAINLAKSADLVLFIGGLNHERGGDDEGSDKRSMRLPYHQDSLISAIYKVNPNTIVTIMSGGPFEVGDWYSQIPALLQTSFIGMEGGNALAHVIFGDVNPSGKLTDTWPIRLADSPAHAYGEYPGKDGTVHYNEGLMVGYRYFDTRNVKPRFCFGYGLSYTEFKYSDLHIANSWSDRDSLFTVSFTVTNTGKREGKETAQLYVHQEKCLVERPYKELKGFAKLSLKPGESKPVTITLNRRALQYYDVISKVWKDDAGKFEIMVGTSCNDIRLTKEVLLVR